MLIIEHERLLINQIIIIIININIKKCRQRKAGRERLTPYQSEGPSRTIPINLQIERIERVNSKNKKGASS